MCVCVCVLFVIGCFEVVCVLGVVCIVCVFIFLAELFPFVRDSLITSC